MDFVSLPGLTPYETARQLQLRLVELRADDRIPDTVLFLEHEPVITRGRGLQIRSDSTSAQQRVRHLPLVSPLPEGVVFAESERGGDLTLHAPGQLVIYPICKLEGRQAFAPKHDIGAFLRGFEQVFIDLISELTEGQVQAFSVDGATGVWVHRKGESKDGARKLASLGIAVRRWVTYHGLAINCVNDLKAFQLISPCGFAPEVMTRLADWLPQGAQAATTLADWQQGGRAALEQKIADRIAGKASHILRLEAPRVAEAGVV